jgi:polysaccharide biosynthesis protein VpsM
MNIFLPLALLVLIPTHANAAIESYLEIPVTEGMVVSPSIDVNISNNDNIFLASNKLVEREDGSVVNPVRSSYITEINPEIILSAHNGLNNWSLGYRGEFGSYHNSPNDNYSDHKFNSTLHLDFNRRNRFNLGISLFYLHENRGSGISDGAASELFGGNTTPDRYRDTTLNVDYTYGGKEAKGRIVIDGKYKDKTYINNRLLTEEYDRTETEIGGTFYYRILPKTFLVFLGKLKDISYKTDTFDSLGSLDSTEQRYEAGVTWKSSAIMSGKATIGKTYKDFSSSLRNNSSLTSWEVSGLWSPRTYSHIQVLTSNIPSETNGTGNFVKNNSFNIDWNHNWSVKTSTHLAVNLGKSSFDGSSRDDNTFRYQAGLIYQPVNGVKFDLSYQKLNRDSNNDQYDYKNNQIMLSSQVGLE